MTRRFVLALCALLLPSLLLAQQYTAVDVPNSIWTEGEGISPNSNALTGSFASSLGIRGFLFHNGSFQIVAHPVTGAPLLTDVTDVNDRGLAVGYYADFIIPILPPVHGFFFRNGNFTPIDFPAPATDTYPMSVNNFGQVVGLIQDTDCDGIAYACHRRGFLLSHGHYSQFAFPGAAATFARGINNRGVIVGYYDDLPDLYPHGFIYSRGQYFPVNCPASTNAMPFGINDSGDVVATCNGGSVLLTRHRSYSITFPGAKDTSVSSVGNRFQGKVPVTGTYRDSNNVEHGFYALIPLSNKEQGED